ncbi:MAG: sugar transferase [Clostridia bacterium]|nr:sugar transferase [Clostridia bacterium]
MRRELKVKAVKNRRLYWIGKRTFDICASFVALIVLSPLFLVVALLIYIDDPHGSPFFSQERVGRKGKVFRCWKFRSMVMNAEDMLDDLQDRNEKSGPVFKIHDDPRITRVGKFIRRTSIDELPQLWNILKGDMSIVGPRPPLPKEVAQYDDYQKLRLLVTPGLTCYWQVKNNRDEISFDEWVDLDIKYISERSFWVDIKLIFQTVKVSVTGQGT